MDGSDDNELEDDDEESAAVTPSFEQVIIQPKPIPELYVNKDKERIEKKVEIKLEALKEIQVKIKDVNSWKMIWMSEGTGARKEVSIWGMKPVTRTLIKRNKHRVMLGQYAAIGFGSRSSAKPPKSLKGYTMELTDLHISTVSRSSNLDESHVNYLMPYPVAFKMVWWHQSGTIIYPSLSIYLNRYSYLLIIIFNYNYNNNRYQQRVYLEAYSCHSRFCSNGSCSDEYQRGTPLG